MTVSGNSLYFFIQKGISHYVVFIVIWFIFWSLMLEIIAFLACTHHLVFEKDHSILGIRSVPVLSWKVGEARLTEFTVDASLPFHLNLGTDPVPKICFLLNARQFTKSMILGILHVIYFGLLVCCTVMEVWCIHTYTDYLFITVQHFTVYIQFEFLI